MLATQPLAGNLAQAILNQNDPATVRDGAPAYLILIDSLIESSPDDQNLLLAGSKLYGSYAVVFVEEPERARRLSDKARVYARRGLCLRRPQVCEYDQGSLDQFSPTLAAMNLADLTALYAYATAWAGWIQSRSDDFEALAELPKIEAMLDRVVALDETFEGGQAHLYLGIIRSQLSPALGGKPEQGKYHFERAIELSAGKNLPAKVEFARYYARLVYDRELHDHLLKEVLEADPQAPGLTLGNVLAQQQAAILLLESSDFFVE